MTVLDPDMSHTCPRCGEPLVYRRRADEGHVYDCARDGCIVLRSDGTISAATDVGRFYEVEPKEPPRSPRTPVVFDRSMMCPFCHTAMVIIEFSVRGTSYVCRVCGQHDTRPR